MAGTVPYTIYRGPRTEFTEDWAPAASAVKPGKLLEYNGGSVQHHAGTADTGPFLVAVEDYAISDPTADAIDHDYEAGESVRMAHLQGGDKFYGFIEAGGSVAQGDVMEPGGSGNFQAHSGGTPAPNITAMASEDLDNSGGTVAVRVNLIVI